MTTAPSVHAFKEGDMALLVDRKNRHYLLRLQAAGAFHSHVGVLPHAEIIGQEPGGWYRTTRGQTLLCVRPTFSDYVQEMPRVTQVIYPKDLGAILMLADVFPGARVMTAGLGSGALTIALLRAVGERGTVIAYEIEKNYVERGLRNVRAMVGDATNLRAHVGDVYTSIPDTGLDRIILDVPEPWSAVPHVAGALAPSGLFLGYLPTILQVHKLVEALHADGRFQMVDSVEVLMRGWHVTTQSVRPAHRMVAHTAFLVTARRCQPRPGPAPEVVDEAVAEVAEEGPVGQDAP